ncbi:15843_t:CDS:2, partial [Cetraspora pellucida]
SIKVCNLLNAKAWSYNILCSMILCENTETGKYLEAYIITLIKGLENKHLVTGLDFASLYTNLIITYNLLSNKIILSCKEAIDILHDGKKLYKIEFLFNNQTIEAWSIHYNNISEEKSLYARVLKNLSNKQKKIKKCLNKLAGEVTSAGQCNINFVKKFVKDKEFSIKYGNTDSLYLICSEECFQKCDQKYKLDQFSQEKY